MAINKKNNIYLFILQSILVQLLLRKDGERELLIEVKYWEGCLLRAQCTEGLEPVLENWIFNALPHHGHYDLRVSNKEIYHWFGYSESQLAIASI